ncbi:ion channel [Fodinicurvata sp. EGI_FJ10296]|uniref:potassium channel family protein n=1 Tax=Fodinicurvata sp. EGI_FJ10296 TaxID=3231908 RepID=UPI0034570CA1
MTDKPIRDERQGKDQGAAEPAEQSGLGRFGRLRVRLRHLYHGTTPDAVRFQIATLTLDLIVIGFFILTPVLRGEAHYLWIDYSIAALIALDIVARTLASWNVRRRFLKITVWVDILILVTLLFPYALGNFGFLRILRLWSLSRSGVLWRPLERRGYHEWRDATHATVNLLTFLFVVSGFVYTNFAYRGYGIDGYVDALYFTVATVTTTGYGDITLPGPAGKLTAIAAMIIGISLFFRLAQSVFRPSKVTFPCPRCALQRHDPDAVHCKACGHQLRIPDYDD